MIGGRAIVFLVLEMQLMATKEKSLTMNGVPLKYLSLVALTLQNTGAVLIMRKLFHVASFSLFFLSCGVSKSIHQTFFHSSLLDKTQYICV